MKIYTKPEVMEKAAELLEKMSEAEKLFYMLTGSPEVTAHILLAEAVHSIREQGDKVAHRRGHEDCDCGRMDCLKHAWFMAQATEQECRELGVPFVGEEEA